MSLEHGLDITERRLSRSLSGSNESGRVAEIGEMSHPGPRANDKVRRQELRLFEQLSGHGVGPQRCRDGAILHDACLWRHVYSEDMDGTQMVARIHGYGLSPASIDEHVLVERHRLEETGDCRRGVDSIHQ